MERDGLRLGVTAPKPLDAAAMRALQLNADASILHGIWEAPDSRNGFRAECFKILERQIGALTHAAARHSTSAIAAIQDPTQRFAVFLIAAKRRISLVQE